MRRGERGNLIETDNFHALAHFSFPERALHAAGMPELLRRALSFCGDRHHSDVANILIGQRHGGGQVNRAESLTRACL
jgi:hypothetical protein